MSINSTHPVDPISIFFTKKHWLHPLSCRHAEAHPIRVKEKDIAISVLLGILTVGVGGIAYFFYASAREKVKHEKKLSEAQKRTNTTFQNVHGPESPYRPFLVRKPKDREDWLLAEITASERTYPIEDWERPGIFVFGDKEPTVKHMNQFYAHQGHFSKHGWNTKYNALSLNQELLAQNNCISTHQRKYQFFKTLVLLYDLHCFKKTSEESRKKNLIMCIDNFDLTADNFLFQQSEFSPSTIYQTKDNFSSAIKSMIFEILYAENHDKAKQMAKKQCDALLKEYEKEKRIPVSGWEDFALKRVVWEKFITNLDNQQVLLDTEVQLLMQGEFGEGVADKELGMVIQEEDGAFSLRGKNKYGICLMELREYLRTTAHVPAEFSSNNNNGE